MHNFGDGLILTVMTGLVESQLTLDSCIHVYLPYCAKSSGCFTNSILVKTSITVFMSILCMNMKIVPNENEYELTDVLKLDFTFSEDNLILYASAKDSSNFGGVVDCSQGVVRQLLGCSYWLLGQYKALLMYIYGMFIVSQAKSDNKSA